MQVEITVREGTTFTIFWLFLCNLSIYYQFHSQYWSPKNLTQTSTSDVKEGNVTKRAKNIGDSSKLLVKLHLRLHLLARVT